MSPIKEQLKWVILQDLNDDAHLWEKKPIWLEKDVKSNHVAINKTHIKMICSTSCIATF